MPNISHLKVTQAMLVSAFTFVVGQVVAFVPALGPDKQNLISAGSAVISAIFLLANSVHHLADSNVSAKDVETGAINAARQEVGKINLNQLVADAVSAQSVPDLEAKVEAAASNAVRNLLGQLAVPAVSAPAAAGNVGQTPLHAETQTVQPGQHTATFGAQA